MLCQGLSSEYDLKKIIKVAKKEFACNGTVVDHSEYGEVLQLQVPTSGGKIKLFARRKRTVKLDQNSEFV